MTFSFPEWALQGMRYALTLLWDYQVLSSSKILFLSDTQVFGTEPFLKH